MPLYWMESQKIWNTVTWFAGRNEDTQGADWSYVVPSTKCYGLFCIWFIIAVQIFGITLLRVTLQQALSSRPKTADEVLLEKITLLEQHSRKFEQQLALREQAFAGQEALSFSVWLIVWKNHEHHLRRWDQLKKKCPWAASTGWLRNVIFLHALPFADNSSIVLEVPMFLIQVVLSSTNLILSLTKDKAHNQKSVFCEQGIENNKVSCDASAVLIGKLNAKR